MDHTKNVIPDIELMAGRLLDARTSGAGIPTSAIPVPKDTGSAMQIQALVQEGSRQPVMGWKVAIGPERMPIAAPLVSILRSPAKMQLFPNCLIEAEVAFVLGHDLPKRDEHYRREEIIAAIDRVFLGIEVIGGRFLSPKDVPFLAFLADHLGNRAFVVGEVLPFSAIDALSDLECQVSTDETLLFRSKASHPAKDPLAPLCAYANQPNDNLGGLKAGQIVTTGSVCGVLPMTSIGSVKVELGKLAKVAVEFTGAT